ncbi:19749_t:CDS:1, partial [Gigaspora rosea]
PKEQHEGNGDKEKERTNAPTWLCMNRIVNIKTDIMWRLHHRAPHLDFEPNIWKVMKKGTAHGAKMCYIIKKPSA